MIKLAILVLALLTAIGCSNESGSPSNKVLPSKPARVLQFYAYPGTVMKGEWTSLCYGVEGVRTVRIKPGWEAIAPSENKCIVISPQATTEYTLSAEGSDGRTVSQKLSVEVKSEPVAQSKSQPAPAHRIIKLFVSSAEQVSRGQMVTLCYSLSGATAVRVEPDVRDLHPESKACFAVTPQHTTTYTLIATGKSGETERETATITVR